MERYKIMKELGDGTCGCVYKALNLETNEIVAIKKMRRKFYYWDECVNLREVKSLCKLNHPNIVKLKEVVRENNELFFIFEYMEYNLYQIIKDRQTPLSEADIRSLMSQVLQGLSYMHRNGYFHRDLKPENLLVTNDTIKIADFGLARETSSKPPYTDYVSTRWYRAPEVLLQSSSYTPAIDMWAIGAILAELFTLFPIFPGESETDQLFKICRILGTPNWSNLPEGINHSCLINCQFSETAPVNLSDIIPNASMEAIDLIEKLCCWDPRKRLTAEQALQHPFFLVGARFCYPPSNSYDEEFLMRKLQSGVSKPKLELSLWDFGPESDDCFLGLTLAVKPSVSIPNQNGNGVPPSSYFMNSQVTYPMIGIPQSEGSAYSSFQSSVLERPLMAASLPYQQRHFFG
ncbi:cyclin-dependent kinase [Ranunculus cassubicifolius]